VEARQNKGAQSIVTDYVLLSITILENTHIHQLLSLEETGMEHEVSQRDGYRIWRHTLQNFSHKDTVIKDQEFVSWSQNCQNRQAKKLHISAKELSKSVATA